MLIKDLGIEVIGIATSFAEALALTGALKPDVLLMDLHMPDEREFAPELVKSQILLHTKCVIAMSLWNDEDARTLAEGFGAHVLLDKMKLYSELIPSIKHFCPSVCIPKITVRLTERPNHPSTTSIEAA